MTFQPVVPFSGIAGWSFLSRTREAQETAFRSSGPIERDVAYFNERIADIRTAEDLVGDRRLLSIALTAFGLEEDINSTFFVRKVLEEGTLAQDALANRLSDKRYFGLARAFGFDLTPPSTVLSDFGPKITSQFQTRSFESAVGDTNPDMRLALGLERELSDLTNRQLSDDGLWFTVMATPPLRTVFEGALRIPASVATLDIDRQLEIFKSKSAVVFGSESPKQFSDAEKVDLLRQKFLAASQVGGQFSSLVKGASALALLQSSGQPSPLLI